MYMQAPGHYYMAVYFELFESGQILNPIRWELSDVLGQTWKLMLMLRLSQWESDKTNFHEQNKYKY